MVAGALPQWGKPASPEVDAQEEDPLNIYKEIHASCGMKR